MSGPVPPSAGGEQDAPALPWFRSSYSSSGDGNDCVEVAIAPGSSARRSGPQGRRHPLLADR
ncbi:DUF397 domain-containing protein [Streptomyces cellulosae]